MAQIVKTIGAGRWRYSVAYSKRSRSDSPKARAAKAQHSSAAQQVLNRKLSRLGLTGIIAANFADCDSARFVTLTFDKEHYPQGKRDSELYEFAIREAELFCQRAKRLCRRRDAQMRTVYAVGGGDNLRYHIHFCLDTLSGEDIRALWGRGNADYHRLDDRQDDPEKWDWLTEDGNVNPAQIAAYMDINAECTPLGRHRWHASRNCERPEVIESNELPDNVPIPVPTDAEVLQEGREANQYSEFRTLELILPRTENIPERSRKKRRSAA